MHLGAIRVKPQSHIRAVWQCDKCPAGHPHIWTAIVAGRTRGRQCWYCCNKRVCLHSSLATIAPDAAQYWNHSKNEQMPEQVLAGSHSKAEWKCPTCNAEWQAPIHTRTHRRSGCPECSRANKDVQSQPTFSLPAWLSGTTSATMAKASTQTTPLLAAGSWCTGSAHAVQGGSCTIGQQCLTTA